ncbi:hypothetical protein Gotur_022370 [Gossypium turneri]
MIDRGRYGNCLGISTVALTSWLNFSSKIFTGKVMVWRML